MLLGLPQVLRIFVELKLPQIRVHHLESSFIIHFIEGLRNRKEQILLLVQGQAPVFTFSFNCAGPLYENLNLVTFLYHSDKSLENVGFVTSFSSVVHLQKGGNLGIQSHLLCVG